MGAGTGLHPSEMSDVRLMPVIDEPGGEGTAAATEPADAGAGWLSMGAASTLLGVSTATLRRWAAEGRIATFTTPGGHRRIRPATVAALIPGPPSPHSAISGSATSGQIHRAYHSMQEEGGLPTFLDGVPSGAREPLRSHGRIVAASIMRYLDARADDPREAALAEGLIAAAAYGRIAGALGATMRETVATFLRFRTPFVHQMAEAARRQGLDAAGATDLLEAVTVAIDRLLDATLEGYESSTTRAGRPAPRRERRSVPAR
jgi:excisionase family DNA binding protein